MGIPFFYKTDFIVINPMKFKIKTCTFFAISSKKTKDKLVLGLI
jgi:hypothetical protein